MGYYIVRMTEASKKQILLSQPRLVFSASNFQESEKLYDELQLMAATDKKLNEISSRGNQIFFSGSKSVPDSYSLSGLYKLTGGDIQLKLVILYNNIPKGTPIQVSGKINDLNQFASEIIKLARNRIPLSN